MGRPSSPLIPLERSEAAPLHRQVYRGLREAILAGRLRPGQGVPSTRALARELRLSRNTVQAAYDQLAAEGFLDGRVGSGTRVAAALPEGPLGPQQAPQPPESGSPPQLSVRGKRLVRAGAALTPTTTSRLAFVPGLPALDAFPFDLWARYVARRLRRSDGDLAGYGDPAGLPRLREAIAQHLRTTRAVSCEPEQVVVTDATQQTLDLSARLLFDEGDEVWMEDPGYPRARRAFEAAGIRPVAVPVDLAGLDVAEGVRRAPNARGVYVTPSHQYPTGAALSLVRRLELLTWARRSGAWILEDDYDSEFRYAGHPLASLQGLDRDGRVIYVGTFSKVLYPSLRLAYAVVPESLLEAALLARRVASRRAAAPLQAALADFMLDGAFAAHLRRMRPLYAERRDALLEALGRELAGALRPQLTDTGLHVTAWLADGIDESAVCACARALGIEVPGISEYAIHPSPRKGLVLGYGASAPTQLREGVRLLRAAVRHATPARSSP